MRTLQITFLAALTLMVSGCATKNYGRQGEVTSYERSTLTCREIDIETAKVHGFLAHVNTESEFDGRSVLSFLGDFGVGNVMEKSSAMESATKRLAQLQEARSSRACGSPAEAAKPVEAAPVALVAQPTAATGKHSFAAQRVASAEACNVNPVPSLAAQGPGFEAYSFACTNGDVLMVRCEFSNCRALK